MAQSTGLAPPLVHDSARPVGTPETLSHDKEYATFARDSQDLEYGSKLDRLNSRISQASGADIDNLMRQLTRRSTKNVPDSSPGNDDGETNEFNDLLAQIFDVSIPDLSFFHGI